MSNNPTDIDSKTEAEGNSTEEVDNFFDDLDSEEVTTAVGILAQIDPLEQKAGEYVWSEDERDLITKATEAWREAGF